MDDVLIVGASGHGEVIADALIRSGSRVCGYLDDGVPVGTEKLGGVVLGNVDYVGMILKDKVNVVVAIGDNFVRERCVNKLIRISSVINFPAVVHPAATVAPSALIERGAVVLAGAVVGVKSRVGMFSIVNTNASLGHHSDLKDFASLAPRSSTGGASIIGSRAAIGMGACVLQERLVGSDSIIGAMALVYSDIPANVVARGVPAKIVSFNEPGRPYLTKPKA